MDGQYWSSIFDEVDMLIHMDEICISCIKSECQIK